jgi:FMN phosphatase YigB (HAD superfamily)
MAIELKWIGFDFGQCMMNPTGLRNHLVIGDVCKDIGEPELTNERIYKYRQLKEHYGSFSAVKEGHRSEIMTYVFDGNEKAMGIFSVKEQEHLLTGNGLEEALHYLKDQGIQISVVAELKKTLGPMGTDIVTRFLQTKGLTHYFDELVTPQGKIDLRDGTIDLSYKGKTKEEGTLYDELIRSLGKRGIAPNEGAMVGDKPATDIIPAKKRGFITIQYTGYVNSTPYEADHKIDSFLKLKEMIRKKV